MTTVRVPGKIMLSGEYAVLFGAEAVLVPAPRHLILREIDSPPSGDRTPVLDIALTHPIPEVEAHERKHPLAAVELDRSEFVATRADGSSGKLGIGGSAAEAVAGIALRMTRAGLDPWADRRGLFDLADGAHRRAQGGVGSGADVAACSFEQPIRYRRTEDTTAVDPIIPVDDGEIPLALLWTGFPANTRELIRPFHTWAHRSDSASLRDELRQVADDLASAWFQVPPPELFTRLDAFVAVMERVMDEAGVPWRLPLHHEVERWARSHGGRAKPTGAGGGDLVLLIGDLPLHERSELVLPLNQSSTL